MAQAMICDGCEQAPGVLLLTFLPTGDVTALCEQCIPSWLHSMADTMQAAHDAPVDAVPAGEAAAAVDTAAVPEFDGTAAPVEAVVAAMDDAGVAAPATPAGETAEATS